jgi:Uma2 family endonuclease
MATEITTKVATPNEIPAQLYRLSVDQYLAMVEHGILGDADLELVWGRLVKIMTKGNPHDYCLGALGDELRRVVGPEWYVREDKSLRLERWSRPEPDLAIVQSPRSLYRSTEPDARATKLVVEVSDTTYAFDRRLKWSMYASAKIPVYGIVHLAQRQVEVYTSPEGRGRSAGYACSETFREGMQVPVLIDGAKVGSVAVDEILP